MKQYTLNTHFTTKHVLCFTYFALKCRSVNRFFQWLLLVKNILFFKEVKKLVVSTKAFIYLPKLMVCICKKLPLGFAPPTICILPLPSSTDGINVQVWPTLTPGALPLGIKEYLLIRRRRRKISKTKLVSSITSVCNLRTIFLLWVCLKGQVLVETPYLSNILYIEMNLLSLSVYFTHSCHLLHVTIENEISDIGFALVKIIVDFTCDISQQHDLATEVLTRNAAISNPKLKKNDGWTHYCQTLS